MFVNGDRITHLARFDVELKDGDRVVLTHFLGGG
jgi:molybdopterin converting factor small subunit